MTVVHSIKALTGRLLLGLLIFATATTSGATADGSQPFDSEYSDRMTPRVDRKALRERLEACHDTLLVWLADRQNQLTAGSENNTSSELTPGACYQQALSDLIGDPKYHVTD
jgi:hypothetical protein